jgi:hypothetical protein
MRSVFDRAVFVQRRLGMRTWLAAGVFGAGLLGAAAAEEVDRGAAVAAIAAAYPAAIASAADEAIVWRDGAVMPLGEIRPADKLPVIIESASLGEQFLFVYPLAPWSALALPADDPGRLRNRDFFQKMYGDCRRGDVQRKLRSVIWLPKTAPQRLQITTVNGLDRVVERISEEIEALPLPVRRAAIRSAGSFSCRMIAGSTQPSMHAYGAAIDLDARLGPYWRWAGLSERARASHRIPQELIDVFERNGFIWGGKWFHVDSPHFEYRPELIEYARRRAAKPPRGDAAPAAPP